MDDKRIIELFFDRNEDAIAETEIKYGRLCYRIAHNILGDEGESEECTGDTYLALWNSIPPQRPSNFRAYAARVARNMALKKYEYNSAKKRSSHMTVSLCELEEVLPDENFKFEIEDEPLGQMISDFLYSEKEDARLVFIRRYYFYDDIRTISKNYSFSESKVKSMLYHTRQRLREYLTEKGVYI